MQRQEACNNQKEKELFGVRTSHTTKQFSENLLAVDIKKPNIYCQFTRLTNIRYQQIAKYEFWYCCIKLKYGENAALCNMGTDNFTVHIETVDIYIDVAKNFETKKIETSNCKVER